MSESDFEPVEGSGAGRLIFSLDRALAPYNGGSAITGYRIEWSADGAMRRGPSDHSTMARCSASVKPEVTKSCGRPQIALRMAATVVAGLLGPIAIALYAIMLSLPVWVAWWWLAHRG